MPGFLPLLIFAPSLALGAPSASTSSAQVEILSIGGYRFAMSMPLVAPFERMLRDRAKEAQTLNVENIPVFFNGNTYHYQLPETPGQAPAPASTSAVHLTVLESEYGFFAFSSNEPELMEEFERLARRPESYKRLMLPQLSPRKAELSSATGPEGSIHSLVIHSPRPVAGQWRKGLALVYRLWLRGRPVDALFIYKTQGGLGRLASAMAETRKDGLPKVVVSRGSLLSRDAMPGLEGRARIEALEKLGLEVSAVGLGELREWDAVESYRRARPRGVAFVSANLVLSSAPATRALPPYAVVERGGLRIGLLGLTRPSYGKYMTAGELRTLAISDPVQAAQAHIAQLRALSDIVIVLSNLEPEDNARLRDGVRGIDAIVADDEAYLADSQDLRSTEEMDAQRLPFDPCLLLASEFSTALDRILFAVGAPDASGARFMRARQTHLVLDEAVADQQGYPEFDSEAYGIRADTEPVLIPAARRIFPEDASFGGPPTITARDFWTLAASLMAYRTKSEAALLPLLGISLRTSGDITEGMVKDWFSWEDQLVTFELPGADLSRLLAQVSEQKEAELQEIPLPSSRLRIAAGGVGPDNSIHHLPLDPALFYRVAGTELLLGNSDAYPALKQARDVRKIGDLSSEVLAQLREASRENWPAERYRALMGGAPLLDPPLWKLDFRDISLNVTDTKLQRDQDAFSRVPSPRIQGFDQQLLGVAAKVDLDYLKEQYKWSNSFVMEYSKARLHPPGLPEVINTPTNRLSLATSGTRRIGSFPVAWMATAYGPSLGLQYEGEVEKTPGLRRKQIYYLYPGVELFNGTVLKSLEFSGNVKRDYSRDTPNTQYGFRTRAVGSSPIKTSKATLQGEVWANYLFLTRSDSDQDLRWEGDVNLKLQVPLYSYLTIAPFIDFYYFELKVRPLAGYSAITGISLGFSRIWKPQYEKF